MHLLRKAAVASIIGLLFSPGAWAYLPLDQAATADENAFKYSVSLAPTFAWPHFNKLNDSLSFSGNEFTNQVFRSAQNTTAEGATGFKNISMDYGAQITVAHEFDEDTRAGIVFGTSFPSTSEKLKITPAPTATNGTPSGYWTATDYSVSQSISLPLFQVGVFWQRLFRFEEEPNLKLYLGGWGNFGTLFSSRLSGKAYNMNYYPRTEYEYDATLTGNSWGAGVMGGIEYTLTRLFTAYLETGWDYFIINSVERSGTLKTYLYQQDASGNEFSTLVKDKYSNLSQWKDGNDNTIPLDFGGVFIRVGVRMGLGF